MWTIYGFYKQGEKMNQYRIVTNNNTFRIQKLIPKRWFNLRDKWEFLGHYWALYPRFKILDYETYDTAKTTMDGLIRQEEIDSRPWLPIKKTIRKKR